MKLIEFQLEVIMIEIISKEVYLGALYLSPDAANVDKISKIKKKQNLGILTEIFVRHYPKYYFWTPDLSAGSYKIAPVVGWLVG